MESGSIGPAAPRPKQKPCLRLPPGRGLPVSSPLAIVPQICETMIRMSQTWCAVLSTSCLILSVFVAGCCGSGPTHKCDFSPPPTTMNDGGVDGQLPCGTMFCDLPQVCCVKKVPLSASCIDQADFVALGCEKMDLPCLGPKDCPNGLTCCLSWSQLSVSCRPVQLCPNDMTDTYLVCSEDADCPNQQINSCTPVSETDQGSLSICF
jgi:hypothetical protein